MNYTSTGHGGSESTAFSNSFDTQASQQSEGSVARTIEQQTSKLPSDLFLWAAFGAIGVSAILEFAGNHDKSRFVGQWVSPFLLLGVYNKIVKVAGSDRASEGTQQIH